VVELFAKVGDLGWIAGPLFINSSVDSFESRECRRKSSNAHTTFGTLPFARCVYALSVRTRAVHPRPGEVLRLKRHVETVVSHKEDLPRRSGSVEIFKIENRLPHTAWKPHESRQATR